jgi:hypothetical protein
LGTGEEFPDNFKERFKFFSKWGAVNILSTRDGKEVAWISFPSPMPIVLENRMGKN